MIKDILNLKKTIKEELQDFTDIAILGLSGGVDSLVTSCLLVEALGSENVYTIHMPYSDTDMIEGRFNGNSLKIAEKIKAISLVRPISGLVNALDNTIITKNLLDKKELSSNLSKLNHGNSRARARMSMLYGLGYHLEESLKKRVRVIGTGNLSEDYIGYDSKFGDSAWDLCLIGELLKSEVYQLAEHFADIGLIEKNMIDYHPSAGLWEGQSDEEELGYSYAAMEPSILKTRNPETGLAYRGYEIPVAGINRTPLSEVDTFVLNRHFKNRHKHMAPPVIKLREFCE